MKAALKVKAAPEESLRGGAVCSGSAELIVALRQQIHALEELVVEDEGPNDDHGHAELEQQVVKSIGNLQKVIVPMSELYKNSSATHKDICDQSLENIQDDLDRLQSKVLLQNEKNRELLRSPVLQ